jgi:hypothetical protein
MEATMPFLLLKLFGIGRWLKGAATALLGVIGRYPWQAALIASLCLAGWQYRGKQHALADLAAEKQAHAETIKAGEQALTDQIALHDATKAKGAAIKKDQDNDNKTDRAAASAAGDKYAAANRVRGKACVGRASETSASAEIADPGVSESAPAEALVAITRADFDKCTALYPYANGAYKWGVVLREVGLAE